MAASIMAAIGLADSVHLSLLDGLLGGGSEERVSFQYLLALGVSAIFDVPARLLPNLLVVEGRARSAAAVGSLLTRNLIIPSTTNELLLSPGCTLPVSMTHFRFAMWSWLLWKFVMISISKLLPASVLQSDARRSMAGLCGI